MPPLTGRVVAGRYQLLEPIGRGAMGVVWRATDQLLDRDVAVKEVRLNPALGEAERDNAYKRTLREARTAARLSHRGVVTVFDVAEEDGRPYIVMELIRSRSLDDVLATDGPLPPRRAARIAQQLLSALAHAHASGVLHRDVKPSNVLIATGGYDERAVLTDFGIAQFEGDPRLTQTGMVMGSPGFTAPERIRGGSATPASDLWSLGATLYAACEGRGPYEQRGGAITTMSAIINEDAPPARAAGPLAPMIAALMRREPTRRPSAAAAAGMIADILHALPLDGPARVATEVAPAPARQPRPVRAAQSPAAAPATPVPVPPVAPDPEMAPTGADVPQPDASQEGSAAAEAGAPSPGEARSAEPASEEPPAPAPETPEGPPSWAALAELGKLGQLAEAEAEAETAAGAAPGASVAADAVAESGDGPDTAPYDAAASADDEPADAAASTVLEDTAPHDAAADTGEGPASAAEGTAPEDTAPEDGAAKHSAAKDTAAEEGAPRERAAAEDGAAALAIVTSMDTTLRARPHATAAPQGAAGPPTAATTKAPRAARSAPADKDAWWASAYQTERKPGQAAPGAPRAGAPRPAGTPYAGSRPAGQYAPLPAQPAQPASYPMSSRPSGSGTAEQPSFPGDEHPAGPGRPRGGTGGRKVLVILAVLIVIAAAAVAATFLAKNGKGTPKATQTSSGTPPAPPLAATGPVPGFTKKTPPVVRHFDDPSSIVPAGFTTATFAPSQTGTAAGFSIAYPSGWQAGQQQGTPQRVFFTDPGSRTRVEVDLTRHTRTDMLAEAMYIEQQAVGKGKFPDYKQIELAAEDLRGTRGGVWRFDYTGTGGTVMRADDLLSILPTPNGGQSYAIFATAPEGPKSSNWDLVVLPVLEQMLSSFHTVPSS